LEGGAAGKELVELGRDTHDLFEAVEDEQRRPIREVLDQDVQCLLRALNGRSHCGSDARQHQLGLSDRLERHEYGPLRVARIQLLTDGDRKPRLADAAGTGQGDQPDPGRPQQLRDGNEVLFAPDQRRRRHRQRARAPPVGIRRWRRRAIGAIVGSPEPLAQEQR
jgi:hypothetical protein